MCNDDNDNVITIFLWLQMAKGGYFSITYGAAGKLEMRASRSRTKSAPFEQGRRIGFRVRAFPCFALLP